MSFILLRSGHRFDPDATMENTYLIEDIAHALSKEVRYGGHCRGSYTVAQHSVLCSKLVSPPNALCALMHDATEAYIKDIPKPIKAFLGASYEDLEYDVWQGIASTFNLPHKLPNEVKQADQAMMAIEVASDIAPASSDPAWMKYNRHSTDSFTIDGIWTQPAAEEAFLKRFWELTA